MTGCDAVYRERAHLLALLATHYPARVWRDEDEPQWPVLYIDLPTGQVSWHLNLSDLDLFAHVDSGHETWDGHTTDEKYERIREWTRLRARRAW